MEPIRDLSWMAQMANGPLERFELEGFSVAAVSGSPSHDRTGSSVRFRLLFTQAGDHRPVYAVNLERSILGEWLLTEQERDAHRIFARLSAPLAYDEFRIRALERALQKLSAPDKGPSPSNKENSQVPPRVRR
ncbi:MAG: hypothetical protein A2Y36_17010 [Treponema sp. GWA1_62_8]|nr:MAG: hypothetical protein A2Y36_17010 [Treponema sp. GWA1_62_8]